MKTNAFLCAVNFMAYFIEGNVMAPANMFMAGILFACFATDYVKS